MLHAVFMFDCFPPPAVIKIFGQIGYGAAIYSLLLKVFVKLISILVQKTCVVGI